jgi:protein-tyrosine phosphatase
MGYYDIHSHILSGMDDGPPMLDDALALAWAYSRDGAAGVIATPHFSLGSDVQEFLMRRDTSLDMLKRGIRSMKIKLDVKPGCELMIGLVEDFEAAFKVVEKFARRLCLNESHLLLVEFPDGPEPLWFRDSLNRMQKIGLQPVVAHLERYFWLRNRKLLESLVEKGIYFQVNADCLRRFLNSSSILMRSFTSARLVRFIATDAHDANGRRPGLGSLPYRKYFWQFENSSALCQNGQDHIFHAV